jgi:hypothetical protein
VKRKKGKKKKKTLLGGFQHFTDRALLPIRISQAAQRFVASYLSQGSSTPFLGATHLVEIHSFTRQAILIDRNNANLRFYTDEERRGYNAGVETKKKR